MDDQINSPKESRKTPHDSDRQTNSRRSIHLALSKDLQFGRSIQRLPPIFPIKRIIVKKLKVLQAMFRHSRYRLVTIGLCEL